MFYATSVFNMNVDLHLWLTIVMLHRLKTFGMRRQPTIRRKMVMIEQSKRTKLRIKKGYSPLHCCWRNSLPKRSMEAV